ncbi:hypothetical protein OEB99_05895 [Actinotalea sp. M2MS4P-6]|uniref:hypothetical protein n=1 Tax=Actinotalea sp. M2MS4P-6 TaxID=2983762 RepID=UPI0021E3660E|nr:hypothetical protein [Actinotalea sp. M2MS4P-6]MCV2393834.1 hypothetical protein [Actinotalea sp. M2MS4P-6]
MDRDLVEVELDETLPGRAPRRSRVPLAAAVGILAVVAVVLQGSGHTPAPDPPAPTETSAPTRLAGATIAPSLAEPWQVLWEVPGTVLDVGDTVLASTPDGTGVVGLAADGRAAFGPAAVGTLCSPSGRGVVCLPGPDGERVVRAISGTGSEVTFTPDGVPQAWWVQDGDVVTVAKDGETLVVQRWTPPGRRGVSWTYRSSDPVVAPASYPFSVEHSDTWVRVGGTHSVTVDLLTGREIPDASAASPARATLPKALLGLNDRSVPGLAVISDGDTVLVDGRWHYPAPAHLIVGGMILVGSGSLAAYDVASGMLRWETAGSGAFSDGALIGLVESGTRTDLVARDPEYGDILWTVPLPDCAVYRGITSAGAVLDGCGRVLLVGPGGDDLTSRAPGPG